MFIPNFKPVLIAVVIKMQEILELSVAERISMIETIWETIDKSDLEITPEQKQELDRRLDRFEKGETTFVSWDEIKKEFFK
ncbi:MAG TPA: addiction module protein [Mucilaginibacter sp.]